MPKVSLRHQNRNLGCEKFRTQAGCKTTWRESWGCRQRCLANTRVESWEVTEWPQILRLGELLPLSEIQIPQPKEAPLPEKIKWHPKCFTCLGPQMAREQVKGTGRASVEGWVLAPERAVLCILPSLLHTLPLEGSSHWPSNGPHGFCSLTGAGGWKLGRIKGGEEREDSDRSEH